MNEQGGEQNLRAEIEELKKALAVQSATQAGQTSTTAATFMGTWSTIAAGAGMLIVGIFLGIAINQR